MNPTTPTNEDPTTPQVDPVAQDATTNLTPPLNDSVVDSTSATDVESGNDVTESTEPQPLSSPEPDAPISAPEPTTESAPLQAEQVEVSSVDPTSEPAGNPTTIDATQPDTGSSPAAEQIDEEAL